jgi:hypothetical protein
MMRLSTKILPILLFLIFYVMDASAIEVRVGPMFQDREGGDTEVRFQSISISKERWSLKDGKTDEKETAVTLMILRPQPDIIGLNLDKSEIKSLTDDKGTNLLGAGKKAADGKPNIETTPPSPYSQALTMKIWSSVLPHPDASRLKVEGTVVLVIGVNRTTVENRNVLIKEGSEINAGPFMLKITKIGAPDVNKLPWLKDQPATAITIETESNRRLTRDIQFTDNNGNYVNVSMMGSSVSADKSKEVFDYIIMNQIDKVNVKVSYWAGTEEIVLPFIFETGLDGEVAATK